MTARRRLSEEEAALIALMEDETGIDLVEFAYREPTSDDQCYRLRKYQWYWWACEDARQISACARDVGKSEAILARCAAFPLARPGFDLFLSAPSLDHLRPLMNKIEERLRSMRLVRELLDARQGKSGISRIPSFEARFVNRSNIITRLPKMDGKGVKGQHAVIVIIEEGQDFPEPGWTEIIPTLRDDVPGAKMLVYGVTTGLGNTFDYHADHPDSLFRLHRKIAPEKDAWGPEMRSRALKANKAASETAFDYQRNIFGSAAGVASENFVTGRLMACVRHAESAWAIKYNEEIYKHILIEAERLLAFSRRAVDELILPPEHLGDEYISYWGGMDIGLTVDPSELLIFGFTEKGSKPLYRLLTRITMRQIPSPHQLEVIKYILGFYGPRLKRFSMDKTGVGQPMFEHMTETEYADRVAGYHFSNKVLAGWEHRDREPGEKEKDLELHNNIKTLGLDILRRIVDAGQMELPMDQPLLRSWLGVDPDDDHALDAGRMLGASIDLYRVDAEVQARKPAPIGTMWGF